MPWSVMDDWTNELSIGPWRLRMQRPARHALAGFGEFDDLEMFLRGCSATELAELRACAGQPESRHGSTYEEVIDHVVTALRRGDLWAYRSVARRPSSRSFIRSSSSSLGGRSSNPMTLRRTVACPTMRATLTPIPRDS